MEAGRFDLLGDCFYLLAGVWQLRKAIVVWIVLEFNIPQRRHDDISISQLRVIVVGDFYVVWQVGHGIFKVNRVSFDLAFV